MTKSEAKAIETRCLSAIRLLQNEIDVSWPAETREAVWKSVKAASAEVNHVLDMASAELYKTGGR